MGRAGVLHETQSSIEFQWLGAHRRGSAEPAELPKEQGAVADEGAIVSGMAGRYATALFELAREQNAIDTVKVNLDRFDALVAEVADLYTEVLASRSNRVAVDDVPTTMR